MAGAPEWMVTFSDCMTLLLTFFVLLLSFSSFDNQAYEKMNKSMVDEFTSLTLRQRREKNAFRMRHQISYSEELDVGSEKPTENPNEVGGIKTDNSPNFRDQKVFFVPSDDVFWANGTALTSEGKNTLSLLSTYLKKFPNRIVVYEGTHTPAASDLSSLNIDRAWHAIEYISEAGSIDKGRFSIASATTLPMQAQIENKIIQERLLEIVMIESSVCR